MTTDLRSIAGKRLEIAFRAQILVVGAGPAGIAAARRAHEGGAQVLLVDENPVPFETMGESVPQIWGGRMGGEVRNRTAMTERMLEARPDLAELFEAGVDVRLGAACWGLFANQRNLDWMPGVVAGLIDDENGNHLVQVDQAIVATGRRDMGLAFPGWDLPGVIGAGAAVTLARLYGALDAKVCTVIGSTPEALLAALDLAGSGVRVAAVIEQADTPCAPGDLVTRLAAAGIGLRLGEVPRGVTSDAGGVTGLVLREGHIACDTVVVGVGAVPMIDLLQAGGAQTVFDAARGGFIPQLAGSGQTTLAGVRAAGDCAGIWAGKSADPAIAAQEGIAAAGAALTALGLTVDEAQEPAQAAPAPQGPGYDISAYRKGWIRAAVVEALAEMPVCQCEEVTARDILEVRPPRYLNVPPRANECRSLAQILGDGPPDPDQVKRLTRAGMGPCQGRRCREQVQGLLALQDDLDLSAVPLAGYRNPVRPLSLADTVLPEDPAVTEQWDTWFGIPRQWMPWQEIPPLYTLATRDQEEDHVNE